MKIILCDRNEDLTLQWKSYTSDIENVDIFHGDIFDTKYADALVSPANSFGFMDGGIDYAYSIKFGWDLQRRVQKKIQEIGGELLVGQAFSIPIGDENFKNLIVAPTMRVPMRILDPIVVYLATRAAVSNAIMNKYERIVIPGMGTGVGMVKSDWAASLMAAGIKDAFYPTEFPKSFQAAQADHYKAYLDKESK